ncbi:hypothetical protein [Stackebrandtia nassauensis]|uniref:Lipoprotein n=1 Tax=Stackebrandtia nassauensis (strain DSM 44728 / CIP 108903 / NRRL B-16338 / NBRC 102104 / LLR-40K-21) TaxID=446470 RepID=D3PX70_STANL|nr:hypothetical protein [Stackebrandtia nassauensis]ADD41333.1 hypothetical protein Snas_1630 [Stackebrandtia nassauensis DSM 44728]
MTRILRVCVAALGLAAVLGATACDDKPDDKASESASASASESPSDKEEKTTESAPEPDSKEAGIARFEEYMHSVGSGDAKGACEMAAKMFASQKECVSAYGFMFAQMPDNEAKALTKATVDASQVEESKPGELFIPESAIELGITFSEPFGDYPLYFEDGSWYIRDNE